MAMLVITKGYIIIYIYMSVIHEWSSFIHFNRSFLGSPVFPGRFQVLRNIADEALG